MSTYNLSLKLFKKKEYKITENVCIRIVSSKKKKKERNIHNYNNEIKAVDENRLKSRKQICDKERNPKLKWEKVIKIIKKQKTLFIVNSRQK